MKLFLSKIYLTKMLEKWTTEEDLLRKTWPDLWSTAATSYASFREVIKDHPFPAAKKFSTNRLALSVMTALSSVDEKGHIKNTLSNKLFTTYLIYYLDDYFDEKYYRMTKARKNHSIGKKRYADPGYQYNEDGYTFSKEELGTQERTMLYSRMQSLVDVAPDIDSQRRFSGYDHTFIIRQLEGMPYYRKLFEEVFSHIPDKNQKVATEMWMKQIYTHLISAEGVENRLAHRARYIDLAYTYNTKTWRMHTTPSFLRDLIAANLSKELIGMLSKSEWSINSMYDLDLSNLENYQATLWVTLLLFPAIHFRNLKKETKKGEIQPKIGIKSLERMFSFLKEERNKKYITTYLATPNVTSQLNIVLDLMLPGLKKSEPKIYKLYVDNKFVPQPLEKTGT